MGESVISCHIIHNVLEASSKDSVGVGVGGMETWLLINLVTVVDAETSTGDLHYSVNRIVALLF